MFPRGFKTWCENVALQQRRHLGLQATDPIDAWVLAKSLGVTVWRLEDVPGLDAKSRRTLLHEDPDSWSAVTITFGSRDLIILNSAHRGARPVSDLMHEVGHIIIGHKPGRIDVSPDGLLILNTYDAQQENEATWLAGALLLPRTALMLIRRSAMPVAAALQKYGVSNEMFNYRLRMTGVDAQLRHGVRRRSGSS